MNLCWPAILAGLVSYLIGSIPFGYLIARTRGVDIRLVGSGNIGATNVWRCVGRGWGILTYVCDMAKGYVSAALVPILFERLFHMELSREAHRAFSLSCGCLSIVGHNWPFALGFRGGKGVAATLGALAGFAPLGLLVALAVWLLAFLLTRYVSVASICAVCAVALSSWLLYLEEGLLTPIVLTLLAGVAVWRHKSNLIRLWNGTEHRFAFGTDKTVPQRK